MAKRSRLTVSTIFRLCVLSVITASFSISANSKNFPRLGHSAASAAPQGASAFEL